MYQYPYGNTQQLNLDWFIKQWEVFKQQWASAEAGIDHALDAEIARVEAAMNDLYAARDAAVAAAADAHADALDAAQDAADAHADALAAAGDAADAHADALAAAQDAADAHADALAAAQDAADAHNDSLAAAGNALYAEGWAVGEQNGTPVASGSSYYENNAKYYAGNAASDATAADADALEAEGWAVGEQNGTPVASGSPYYENNAKYYAQQAGSGTAAEDMIAVTENSSTAAAKHSTGQYFIYNNILYKAVTDIDIGDTITPNSNCIQITIGEDLSNIRTGNTIPVAVLANRRNYATVNILKDHWYRIYNDTTSSADFKVSADGGNTYITLFASIESHQYYHFIADQNYTDISMYCNAAGDIVILDCSAYFEMKRLLYTMIDPLAVQVENKANKNYAVNDFLFYDGYFFVVTSPIAQGANIMMGSNCRLTVICDLLTSILNS